jgi:hypothetical protein
MANFINAPSAFQDAYEVVHHFKLPAVAVQHFKPTGRHFIIKKAVRTNRLFLLTVHLVFVNWNFSVIGLKFFNTFLG